MAMFPVFMIGVIIGIVLSYVFYKYKEDIPSTVKIEMQVRKIKQQEQDNEMLMKLNDKLYEEINELKKQLNIKDDNQ